MEPLELPQRLPLRLADRLAGGLELDEAGVGAHRRPPRFFFRFTRRGAAGVDDCGDRGGLGRHPRLVGHRCCCGLGCCPLLGRRARALLLRRHLRPRHEPAGDDPLADGPEVRRRPVEDESGLEVDDERDEEERQHEEDHPLRPLHRRRHEVRRGELARDVDDEQQNAPALARRSVMFMRPSHSRLSPACSRSSSRSRGARRRAR